MVSMLPFDRPEVIPFSTALMWWRSKGLSANVESFDGVIWNFRRFDDPVFHVTSSLGLTVSDTTTEWFVSPILLSTEAVSVAAPVIDSR